MEGFHGHSAHSSLSDRSCGVELVNENGQECDYFNLLYAEQSRGGCSVLTITSDKNN